MNRFLMKLREPRVMDALLARIDFWGCYLADEDHDHSRIIQLDDLYHMVKVVEFLMEHA